MDFTLSFGSELEDIINKLFDDNIKESKQEIKKEKYQKHKVLLGAFDLDIKYFSIPEQCICGNKLDNIKFIQEYPMIMPVLHCKCGISNYPKKI